jgi:hypothetical protein
VAVSLAVGAFIALRSPFLLLALPLFVTRFSTNFDIYWTAFWQYSTPIMPIVFIASIEAIQRLRQSDRPVTRTWARATPVVIPVVALALIPTYGWNMWVTSGALVRDDRAVAVERAVDLIPADSTVQADDVMTVHVVSEFHTFHLHWPDQPLVRWEQIGADYVLLDDRFWNAAFELDGAEHARSLNPSHDYETMFESHDIVLMKRIDN